jgi:hypothetical protein
MQALIAPNQKINSKSGVVYDRIAEVNATPFEVAQPLYWQECSDDCIADIWGKNCDTGAIEIIEFAPSAPEIQVEELP